MYGTVARLRLKPDQDSAFADYLHYWANERKSNVKGAVGGYIYQLDTDPGTAIMAVVFEDKESYVANAQSPAQDADYQRLRALLVEDPIWEDGEIIATL
jgi:quinol monooxygenase YgiN